MSSMFSYYAYEVIKRANLITSIAQYRDDRLNIYFRDIKERENLAAFYTARFKEGYYIHAVDYELVRRWHHSLTRHDIDVFLLKNVNVMQIGHAQLHLNLLQHELSVDHMIILFGTISHILGESKRLIKTGVELHIFKQQLDSAIAEFVTLLRCRRVDAGINFRVFADDSDLYVAITANRQIHAAAGDMGATLHLASSTVSLNKELFECASSVFDFDNLDFDVEINK